MLFEVASGGMVYVPSFIEIDSDVQNLLWDTRVRMCVHDQHADLITLASFFQINESKPKTVGI
jgi:hypothetical protein